MSLNMRLLKPNKWCFYSSSFIDQSDLRFSLVSLIFFHRFFLVYQTFNDLTGKGFVLINLVQERLRGCFFMCLHKQLSSIHSVITH